MCEDVIVIIVCGVRVEGDDMVWSWHHLHRSLFRSIHSSVPVGPVYEVNGVVVVVVVVEIALRFRPSRLWLTTPSGVE